MTTKTMELRAIDLMPGLGNDRNGISLGQLSSLIGKVRQIVADDEEGECRAFADWDTMVFRWPHKLTVAEQLQDDLAAMKAKLDAVAGLRHPDGTLVPDAAERLARILG